MSRLEDMQIYVEAVERGGFSAAAQRLGLSKQYVSRRVGELEARLGVRLLNRTTRKLSPTALGLDYFERAQRVLAAADDADRAVSSHGALPRGRLRLTAPMSFGMLHVGALVMAFLERCPEVEIDIDLNDRIVDLVSEGYDMAVRIGVLPDSSLIARRLRPIRHRTVASPAYLARAGMPADPGALKSHACLLYGHGRPVSWCYRIGGEAVDVPVDGRLRANNGDLLRDAALRGQGLTQLPEFIVDEALRAGTLATVLDDFAPPDSAVHVVYPCHRQPSAVVQAFGDVLAEALGQRPE